MTKKNVAICVFGVHPWETRYDRSEPGQDYIQRALRKHIYDVNPEFKFHVFLHSWSLRAKDDLLNMFHPTDFIIEKQMVFDKVKKHDPRIYNKMKKPYCMKLGEIFYSHLYSMSKAVDLKKQFEKKHKMAFDYVMLSRLDLVWFHPLKFSTLNTKHIHHLAFSHLVPERLKETVIDYVFISDSRKIDVLGDLYNQIDAYTDFGLHAEYIKYQHLKAKKLVNTLKGIPDKMARLYRRCTHLGFAPKPQQELPERYRKVILKRRNAVSFVRENSEWKAAQKRLGYLPE